MTTKHTIETERLLLRPFTLDDVPDVVEYAKDIDVYRWTLNIPHPYSDKHAREYIASCLEKYEKREAFDLAIASKETGRVIGGIGFPNVDLENVNAEIGYCLGKPYWGNGYTTEAAKAIIQYGFEEMGLERIYGKCFAGNDRSSRVLEKAGMKYEGLHRHEILKDGKFIDALYFSILSGD